jgi:hypothetical protein
MALTLHGTVSDNTVALDRKTATPLIINGDMQIAQRGTSVSTFNSDAYHTVDRWKNSTAGTISAEFTISQDSDVPTGEGFSNSLKYDCTTANASLGTSTAFRVQTRIEGQNIQMLKKGTSNAESVTFSFWVKSAKTGTYILELFDADNNRSISKSYTVDSANTWEKKVLSFAGDTTGAFDNDNAQSLQINWYLFAGTDYTSGTLQTSWATRTNANRAVGNVNLADSTSNDWYITGVQLEVGTFDANSIPDFQFEDRTTSFNRCSRYFYRQYSNAPYSVFANGFVSNSTTARVMQRFPQQRALPTFSSSGSFQVIEGGDSRSVSSIASDNNSRSLEGARLDITTSSASAGNGCMLRASNDTDAYIEADSEL